jgi:ferredoxin
MRVVADHDRCIGAGNCSLMAPAVFDQDREDGTVVVLDETPPESELPAVQEAVDRCPAAVLQLLPG